MKFSEFKGTIEITVDGKQVRADVEAAAQGLLHIRVQGDDDGRDALEQWQPLITALEATPLRTGSGLVRVPQAPQVLSTAAPVPEASGSDLLAAAITASKKPEAPPTAPPKKRAAKKEDQEGSSSLPDAAEALQAQLQASVQAPVTAAPVADQAAPTRDNVAATHGQLPAGLEGVTKLRDVLSFFVDQGITDADHLKGRCLDVAPLLPAVFAKMDNIEERVDRVLAVMDLGA